MEPNRKHKTICALALACTFMLAGWFALAGNPTVAHAHNVTAGMCRASASAHIQQHGSPTLAHWRRDFRKCMAWRKAHNLAHICRPARPTVGSIRVKRYPASLHQRRMVSRVLTVGRNMGARRKVLQSAVMTITQESTAKNLTGGHGSSVGLFQIISMHGPYSSRHNPEWSARWYFSRAIRVDKQRPRLSPGKLAQAVQRSAYPTAYAQWARESRQTLRRWLGPAVVCVRV